MARSDLGDYTRKKGMNMFIFLAYIVFGLYLVNSPFDFIKIPEYVSKFDIWIIFAAGILLLFGAINYFRAGRS